MDDVGRLSRNRFAGLPVPKPPTALPPEGGANAGADGVNTTSWGAQGGPPQQGRPASGGRPSWAAGDRSGPIGAITPVGGGGGPVSAVPQLPGPQAPRVPGLEHPQHVAPPMVTSGRASPPAAGGSDGMDPSDDLLLLQTQRLLSTSLTFAGGPGDVAERLRAALLQAHPALIEALPGTPRSQVEQLAGGLTWLVHNLARPPVLVAGCAQLGAALAAVGVAPHHLQFVGAALAEAMRAGMPPGAWRQDFDLAWRSTWQHAYEWIVHGETTVAQQPAIWTAVVVEHDLRRHDLAVIRLRPDLPMPFTPGQYARIEVAELPGIWRPYSLAGAPRRNDLIELHVRAKTQSGVSGSLVYRTRAGDRLRIGHAEGSMVLPELPGRDLLMIAGDTGVVPLKALLTELADTDDPRSAVLFWGVRNLAELYDIEEITEIARSARRATVVPVVSEGDPGPYASGLVTDAVAAYGEWSDHEVFLAGPPLMLAATSAALHQLGVAPQRIHHDAPE
jgi:NAD(P)H-flavin reductase/hemoglobin-like flavoprotein